MVKKFDRSIENLGNIVGLEHVNVTVPDQITATLFYITGLGLTRDPYLVTGVVNMWVNAGRSQFHLPTYEAAGSRASTAAPRGCARSRGSFPAPASVSGVMAIATGNGST